MTQATGTDSAPSRAQIPRRADFRFWTEEKLRNIDTDQFKHINNAVMASFFEAGRMEMFHALTGEQGLADVGIVVGRLVMNFHKELFYPGSVAIGAVVKRVGTASFDVSQGLFRDQDCIASAEATCILIHQQTRRPYPVPVDLKSRMLAAD